MYCIYIARRLNLFSPDKSNALLPYIKPFSTNLLTTPTQIATGRVSSTGFLPRHPFTSKNRDTLSSSSVAVPPEEVLFRRLGAPERFAEDDVYWRGSRNLREDQVLPDSDLLKALHSYASKFYGRMWGGAGSGSEGKGGGEGAGADFVSLDGTALLAMGILLEEWAGEVLGAEGDGAFVEGEYDGEGEEERVEAGGSTGDRAWRGRRLAERRMIEKRIKVKEGKEVNGAEKQEQAEKAVARRKITNVTNNKSDHPSSQFKSRNNELSDLDQSDEGDTTNSVDYNNKNILKYNSDDTTTTSTTHYNTHDLIDFSASDDDDDDDDEEEEDESLDSDQEDNVNDDDNESSDTDQDDDSAEEMSSSSYPNPNINTSQISIPLPSASSSESESEPDSESDSDPQSGSDSDPESQPHSESHPESRSESHSDSESEILTHAHTRKRRKTSRSQ